MKILRLTPHYYFENKSWPSRFDPLGGQQIQVTNLAEWLSYKNVDQDILTTGFPGIKRKLKKKGNLKVYSVRRLTLPFKSKYSGTFLLDFSWALGSLFWILKNFQKKYNIIHLHSSGVIWPFILGIFASKIFKSKLITTIHCSRNFTYSTTNWFDLLINRLVIFMENKTISRSEIVYVLTDRTRDKYVGRFPELVAKFKKLSDTVGNQHINHMHTKPQCCAENLPKVNFPSGDIILYLGRISYEKGWETFVEVARNIARKDKNAKFLVCGDGPQKKELIRVVETYNISDRFFITGFVSKEIVPCVLNNSCVLVMPSKHEELGGSAIEGIIAGVPIVASKVGGLQTLIKDSISGYLVEPGDVNGFTSRVEKILNEKDIAKRLVKKAKEEIKDIYQQDVVFMSLLKDYNSIVGGEDEALDG
ncbi:MULTISPECIES: glycosyltransferase [Heyndrickxia]|uniref:glycosyltransferase n=1 Tax=Heyndrickxia TaxID=2837504 RepID=UPI0030F58CAF